MKWMGATALALLVCPLPASAKSCPPEQYKDIAALIRPAIGNRKLMFEVGRRLETGDGVERDVECAEHLYKAAATPKIGTVWIFIPGVAGQPGRTSPYRIGPDEPGLPQAAYARALMHIEGRAAKPSYRTGLKLLKTLAESGYGPARNRYDAIMAGPRT